MSTFLIIIGVIAAIWIIGKIAQSTGLDKKAHDMRVHSEKLLADRKEQIQVINQYNSGIDERMKIVEQKIAAVSQSLGISLDEASDKLYKECETHEKLLIEQGSAPVEAASKAFKKVFRDV